MPINTVTLGSGATRLQSNQQRAMELIIAPAAHEIYVADSASVSSSKGIPVPTTGPPVAFGPFTSGALQLDAFYVAGTEGDTVSYWFTPEV